MRKVALFALIVALAVMTAACGGKQGHDKMAHGNMSSEEEPTTIANWNWSSSELRPSQDAALSIQITDADGKAVDEFKINHEKPMHLVVVSKDLSYFHHIHPSYEGEGKFVITTQFPNSGSYKLIADYIPSGGQQTTQSLWADVQGTGRASQPIVPDMELKKTVNGVIVQLEFDKLTSGDERKLTFHMTDAKTGKAITDLQPYLGAVGHVVILSDDAENYLHVHPTAEDAKGPDAEFMTTFPHAGVYKIWGQFKHNGHDFVVSFVVKVE